MTIYYKGIKRNGVKRDTHRVTMETHLGRTLSRLEVVHHINGDIQDNRIENLQLMTLAEHSRMHMKGNVPTKQARQKMSLAASRQDPWAQSKLTREQAAQAIKDVDDGESLRSVARRYSLSHSNLLRTINRLLKTETA